MRKQILILILLIFSPGIYAQSINLINLSKLKSISSNSNDTLYVINFWATWCGPCVKEIPYFEEIADQYKTKPIRVILVSLDFKSKIKSQVEPFVKKNIIHSEVYVLDESDMDKFINDVSSSWSGAIPATIFFHKDGPIFYEKSFEKQELKNIVEPLIKRYENID
jgi:thiol-disulfide isomerase/thioredoxin